MTRRPAKPAHGGPRPNSGRKPTTGPGTLVRVHLTDRDRKAPVISVRVRRALDVLAGVEDGLPLSVLRRIGGV